MKLPNLIAITGKAGCGKDTLGAYLMKEHGYAKYNFAKPLYDAVNTMFGWHIAQWADREWKERVIPELGASPRRLLQTMGTEWGRELINPDIWVYLAGQAWTHHCRVYDPPALVITDLRFDNEAEWVLQEGGTIVEVVRPAARDIKEAAHPSELGIARGFERVVVHNDSDIPSYLRAAGAALGLAAVLGG